MMEWRLAVLVIILRYVTVGAENFDSFRHQTLDLALDNEDASERLYKNIKLEHLGKLLANILLQPWPKGISPLLYVEEFPAEAQESVENNFIIDSEEQQANGDELNNVPIKRTRWYRKYPWKRQNARYEPENKYLCQPSKEDVFRLLVALHEARRGSREQMVNFCNRKRPATAVFTNIRFLG